MAGVLSRLAFCGASAVAMLTMAGCSGPSPHQTAAPPSSYDQAPAPSLMGAAPAPSSDSSGLLGGPAGAQTPAPAADPRLVNYRRADGVAVTAMKPVKNPEDMTAAERRKVYGTRYAPRAHVAAHGHAGAPLAAAKPAPKPVVAAAPVAKPAPQVVAAKPLPPVTPAPAPKTVEVAKPAPIVNAAVSPAPTGLPAPTNPKLAALQTAVGGEVAAGSKLTVPEGLAKGETAQVSLSLPQTVLAIIQREAGKLGLGKAARKADVTATLSGQGYEITPNGPQTAKLKLGEAPSFNWQVKPGAGEKGPLKADVDAGLKGAKSPLSFSLASLEQTVKAALPAPRAKTSLLDKLAIPGMPTVKVPGVGVVPSKSVVAVALLLLGLALLVAIARNAGESARQAERRRKFRTMTETGAPEFGTDDHGHGLAAPLAAAAAGAAAAGAVAAHHGHDDHGHGHGHDDHGHEAHGHDDHGHGDHGHGDHGHGHDDQAAAHDDHGHGDHGHEHDDHGHEAHSHDDHGHDDHGHGDHGHGDDHGHAAAHDDHGHDDHGHGDHGHGHDDHGHAVDHDDHGHDDHGHDAHGHHKELEHAH